MPDTNMPNMDEMMADAVDMHAKAKTTALAAVDAKLRDKTGGEVTFANSPPYIRAAVRVGIDAGVSATILVVMEMMERDMDPEDVAAGRAEVERLLAERLSS